MAPAAVILPVPGASMELTSRALEGQSQAPERILRVDSEAALAPALREGSSSWVWLVDAGVIPEPEALAELMKLAAGDGAARPALVVSQVLTPGGTLDPASLPVPEVHRGERLVAALERSALPLRVARRGSILIQRQAVAQLEPRRLLERDLEWTAQLLRGEPGWLAPASRAVRQAPRRRPRLAELADMARLLRVVEPRERLWFAAHFAERALQRP